MTYADLPSPGAGLGGPSDTFGSDSMAEQLFDTRRRLHLIDEATRIAGQSSIDPNFAYQLAQQPIPDDQLVDQTLRGLTATQIDQQAQMFEELPADVATGYWRMLSKPMQQQLIAAGVQVPGASTKHMTGLGNFDVFGLDLGVVGDLLGGGLDAGGDAVGAVARVGGQGLHWLNVAGDTIPHFWRASADNEDNQEFSREQLFDSELRDQIETERGQEFTDEEWRQLSRPFWQEQASDVDGSGSVAAWQREHFVDGVDNVRLDPNLEQEIIDAGNELKQDPRYRSGFLAQFERTATGDRYIPPNAQLAALDDLDGDWAQLNLAVDLASGDSLEEIAARSYDPGTPEFAQEYLRLADQVSAGDMQQVIGRLSGSKVTVGRSIARTLGLNETAPGDVDSWFGAVSGVLDAAVLIFGDPTLVAGKFGKGARAARFLLRSADDAENAALIARGIAHIDDVADVAVDAGVIARMNEGMHSLNPFERFWWRDQARIGRRNWRAAESIADAFKIVDGTIPGNLTQDFLTRNPGLANGFGQLLDHHRVLQRIDGVGLSRPENVLDFFWKSDAGFATLHGGTFARFVRSETMLPQQTARARRGWTLRAGMRRGLDEIHDAAILRERGDLPTLFRRTVAAPESDLAWAATEDVQGDLIRSMARHGIQLPVAGRVMKWGQRTIDSLSTHVPFQEGFQLAGPDIVTEARKLFMASRFGNMTSGEAERYFMEFLGKVTPTDPLRTLRDLALHNGFSDEAAASLVRQADEEGIDRTLTRLTESAGSELDRQKLRRFQGLVSGGTGINVEGRRTVVSNFMEELFERSGVYDTETGREFANRYTRHIADQRYATGGFDTVLLGGQERAVGILPMADHSAAMAQLDFRGFLNATAQHNTLRRIWRLGHNDMVDGFMTYYWKPSMLLRLGFIPRAAGEELLSYVLREGPWDYVRMQRALAAQRPDTELFLPFRLPTRLIGTPGRLFRRVTSDTVQLRRAMLQDVRDLGDDAAFSVQERLSQLTDLEHLTALQAEIQSGVSRYWGHAAMVDSRRFGTIVDPATGATRAGTLREHALPYVKGWTDKATAQMRVAEMGPVDLMAHYIAGITSKQIRRGLAWRMDPELLASARAMLYDHAIRRSYAGVVSGQNMLMSFADKAGGESTTINILADQSGREILHLNLVAPHAASDFQEYRMIGGELGGNLDTRWLFFHQLNRMASDLSFANYIGPAMRGYLAPEQLRQIGLQALGTHAEAIPTRVLGALDEEIRVATDEGLSALRASGRLSASPFTPEGQLADWFVEDYDQLVDEANMLARNGDPGGEQALQALRGLGPQVRASRGQLDDLLSGEVDPQALTRLISRLKRTANEEDRFVLDQVQRRVANDEWGDLATRDELLARADSEAAAASDEVAVAAGNPGVQARAKIRSVGDDEVRQETVEALDQLDRLTDEPYIRAVLDGRYGDDYAGDATAATVNLEDPNWMIVENQQAIAVLTEERNALMAQAQGDELAGAGPLAHQMDQIDDALDSLDVVRDRLAQVEVRPQQLTPTEAPDLVRFVDDVDGELARSTAVAGGRAVEAASPDGRVTFGMRRTLRRQNNEGATFLVRNDPANQAVIDELEQMGADYTVVAREGEELAVTVPERTPVPTRTDVEAGPEEMVQPPTGIEADAQQIAAEGVTSPGGVNLGGPISSDLAQRIAATRAINRPVGGAPTSIGEALSIDDLDTRFQEIVDRLMPGWDNEASDVSRWFRGRSDEVTPGPRTTEAITDQSYLDSIEKMRRHVAALPPVTRERVLRILRGDHNMAVGERSGRSWKDAVRTVLDEPDQADTDLYQLLKEIDGTDELDRVQETLETLWNLDPHTAYLIADDSIPLWTGTVDDLTARMTAAARQALGDPEIQMTARDMYRFWNTKAGDQVALPVPDNYERYSTLMGDESMLNTLRTWATNREPLYRRLRQTGGLATDEQAFLDHVLDNLVDGEFSASVGQAHRTVGGSPVAPLSTVASQDYDLVHRANELLARVMDDEALAAGTQAVTLRGMGFTDLPIAHRSGHFEIENLLEDIGDRAVRLDPTMLGQARSYNELTAKQRFGNAVIDGVDQQAAIDDWSDTLARYMLDMLGTPDGSINHHILEPLLARELSIDTLRETPARLLPRTFIAPRYIENKTNALSRLVRKGFDDVITPAISATVRQPMFLSAFNRNMHLLRPTIDRMRDADLDSIAARVVAGSDVDSVDELRVILKDLPPEMWDDGQNLLDVATFRAMRNRQGDPDALRFFRELEIEQVDGGLTGAWADGRLAHAVVPENRIEMDPGRIHTVWREMADDPEAVDNWMGWLSEVGIDSRAVHRYLVDHGGEGAFTQVILEHEVAHHRWDRAVRASTGAGDEAQILEAKLSFLYPYRDQLDAPHRRIVERARAIIDDEGIDEHTLDELDQLFREVDEPTVELMAMREMGLDPRRFAVDKDAVHPLVDHPVLRPHYKPMSPQERRSEARRPGDRRPRQDLLGPVDGETMAALRDWAKHDEAIEGWGRRRAAQAALADVIPFIDDSGIRSYFQEYVHNLMPFYFAQEQFIRRWARTFRFSPEAIRRGQLMYQGIEHMGFVDTDEYGNDYFVYPMPDAMSNWMAEFPVLDHMFGGSGRVPSVLEFTGQVTYALPGLDDPFGVPSLGPIGAIPMGFLANAFPELEGVERTFLSERGVDRDIFEQVVPSWAVQTYRALAQDPKFEEQMASTTIRAMSALEAKGTELRLDAEQARADGDMDRAEELETEAARYSLREGASPTEVEQWIDTVKNYARRMLFVKGLLGMAGPAAPQLTDTHSLRPEFQELLRNVPFEEAVQLFLNDHPEGLPFTIAQTDNPSMANVPAVAATHQFITDHRDWLQSFPLAGPWFIPASDSTDSFHRKAWTDMQAAGIRVDKTPEEWYADLKFAAGAGVYFDSLERYESARDSFQEGDPARARLDAQWQAWTTAYKSQHPLFAEQLNGESQSQKQAVLDQLSVALRDPAAPDSPQVDAMRTMVLTYEQFAAAMRSVTGDQRGEAQDMRALWRARLYSWATQFLVEHPEMTNLWRSVIQPLAGLRGYNPMTAPSGEENTGTGERPTLGVDAALEPSAGL